MRNASWLKVCSTDVHPRGLAAPRRGLAAGLFGGQGRVLQGVVHVAVCILQGPLGEALLAAGHDRQTFVAVAGQPLKKEQPWPNALTKAALLLKLPGNLLKRDYLLFLLSCLRINVNSSLNPSRKK
ncbi:hypothetical protein PCS_03029 [Desulfocurvibacter africanus PCS]|uniref:Uncharacterized protein n=1 Tax=Desulfocurvibacter africanus PCS TaxID=1262666 RepID=M5PQA8_DESAF|nr:hypothetical protein PCS_03029 [Desulfocurvibacter africanus PCS]